MKKTELMNLVSLGRCRECFTFVPDDGTPARQYDITSLRRLLRDKMVPLQLIDVYLSDLVPFLSTNRVWAQDRVDELTPSSYDIDPPIALKEPDGSFIIADGVHRIMKRHQIGRDTIQLFVVEERFAPRVPPGWGQNPSHDWGVPLSSLRAQNG